LQSASRSPAILSLGSCLSKSPDKEPRRRADGATLRANKSADPFATGGKREENGKRTCFAKRFPFSCHLVSGFLSLQVSERSEANTPEGGRCRAVVWLIDLRRGSFEKAQGGPGFGAVVVEAGAETLEAFRVVKTEDGPPQQGERLAGGVEAEGHDASEPSRIRPCFESGFVFPHRSNREK
jgi:hypothetical protein